MIETEQEYERMLEEAEKLMDRGERRTPEEDTLLSLVSELIRGYEDRHFPMPDPSPREALRFLMERRGLKQADLAPVFKSSGYVSDVIHGKREISKAQAKRLATFFGVSTDLFI